MYVTIKLHSSFFSVLFILLAVGLTATVFNTKIIQGFLPVPSWRLVAEAISLVKFQLYYRDTTAYSTFSVPIGPSETDSCNSLVYNQLTTDLVQAHFFIWDELVIGQFNCIDLVDFTIHNLRICQKSYLTRTSIVLQYLSTNIAIFGGISCTLASHASIKSIPSHRQL